MKEMKNLLKIKSQIDSTSIIDLNNVCGLNGELIVGSGCDLRNLRVIFSAPRSILQIGNNCNIAGIIKIGLQSTCVIGNNVTSARNLAIVVLESTTCSIGNDCLFSNDVIIRTCDGHHINDLKGNRINTSKSVRIEDRVWLGSRVIILKGVNICSDSVVGAGSVVSQSFNTSHVIIAGNPARIVKNDICWKY